MKAFLIPGWTEDLKSRDYDAVLKMYKSLGYDPHFVPIQWKYKTVDDWIEQVESQISASEIENSLLSGFSFGSMTALGVAAKTNPKKLLLFSLSPYFKEDLRSGAKYLKWTGKRKEANFEKFSINQLAAKINCPTTIFLGSEEKRKYPEMWRRAKDANKVIFGSSLILIDGVGHDVANPGYVESIKVALK